MNTQIIIEYLSELSANNNREWYHANKEDYKKANAEFEGLLQALIWEIGKFDSSILHNRPKDLTFKLVRDTRFSHDKSPYNPAFRALSSDSIRREPAASPSKKYGREKQDYKAICHG